MKLRSDKDNCLSVPDERDHETTTRCDEHTANSNPHSLLLETINDNNGIQYILFCFILKVFNDKTYFSTTLVIQLICILNSNLIPTKYDLKKSFHKR